MSDNLNHARIIEFAPAAGTGATGGYWPRAEPSSAG